jgi:hypothetical protein
MKTDSRVIAELTLSNYRSLLESTLISYPCLGFEVLEAPPPRFAIIRHDIDMSPTQALALARIESDLGVRATYTILLTGDFYSPFEFANRQLLRQISNLGHDLGLHFDATWHGIESEAELTDAIAWETSLLNRLLDLPSEQRVKMFSFHNTTPFTMSCRASHYAGLRNAYAGYLQENVQYTSDSNGYWIHRSWQELLKQQPDRIQILTHPEWWTANHAHPAEKVCSHLACRSRMTWLEYCTLLQRGNRHNRTGLTATPSALAALFPEDGDRLSMLWLQGNRPEAFIALFCRFESQCRRILRKYFRVNLRATAAPVQALLSDYRLRLDPLLALSVVSNISVTGLLGLPVQSYQQLKRHRNALVHGYGGVSEAELTTSFDRLIHAVGRIADHGSGLVNATGTRRLTTKGMPRSGDAQTLLQWLQAHHQRLDLSIKAIHEFGQRHQLVPAQGAES